MSTAVADTTPVAPFKLAGIAAELPQTWKSVVLGQASGANFKVLRMDASDYADEVHDYPEALLVLDGRMNLRVRGESVPVAAGEAVIVPAGVQHGVAAGSIGTLVVVGV